MSKHLWHLSEELVDLSFFDNAVSFETKQHTFAKLQDEDCERMFLKRPLHPLGFLKDKYLQDFVITKANTFFEILRLHSKFLHADPRFWSKIESFRSAKFFVKNLKSY